MNNQPAQNENEVVFILFTSSSDWDNQKSLYPFLRKIKLPHSYSNSGGLAIWSPQNEQLICVSLSDIIILIKRIKANQLWKTEGLAITRRVTEIPLPDDKTEDQLLKTNTIEAQDRDQDKNQQEKYKLVDEVLITLMGEDAINLSTYLSSNQDIIAKMTEWEREFRANKLGHFFEILLEQMNEIDERKLDLAVRQFSWDKINEHEWRCAVPPVSGYVRLGWGGLLWVGIINSHDEEIKRSTNIGELDKAFDWVETELKTITSHPDFVPEQK